jgi:hypothetical protein
MDKSTGPAAGKAGDSYGFPKMKSMLDYAERRVDESALYPVIITLTDAYRFEKEHRHLFSRGEFDQLMGSLGRVATKAAVKELAYAERQVDADFDCLGISSVLDARDLAEMAKYSAPAESKAIIDLANDVVVNRALYFLSRAEEMANRRNYVGARERIGKAAEVVSSYGGALPREDMKALSDLVRERCAEPVSKSLRN